MKFKVGDRIWWKSGRGVEAIIDEVDPLNGEYQYTFTRNDPYPYDVGKDTTFSVYSVDEDCELISNNLGGEMNDLTKMFRGLFLKEPEKTYRELGITDDNGMITPDGMKLALTQYIAKGGLDNDFYKEVAKPMLEAKNQKEK